jgi:hypothetical protein
MQPLNYSLLVFIVPPVTKWPKMALPARKYGTTSNSGKPLRLTSTRPYQQGYIPAGQFLYYYPVMVYSVKERWLVKTRFEGESHSVGQHTTEPSSTSSDLQPHNPSAAQRASQTPFWWPSAACR